VSAFDESRWPGEAAFIDQSTVTPLQFRIVRRALRDVGLCEIPRGSNRSTRIDRYLREAGVPESVIRSGQGFWCAAASGAAYRDAGAKVPLAYAACQNWLNWGLRNGYLKKDPVVGALVLYGVGNKSNHCGIMIRVDNGYRISLEGNTSLNGYSREGLFYALKETALDKVLGYIHPVDA
jgi:hypothetical protein